MLTHKALRLKISKEHASIVELDKENARSHANDTKQ